MESKLLLVIGPDSDLQHTKILSIFSILADFGVGDDQVVVTNIQSNIVACLPNVVGTNLIFVKERAICCSL